MHFSYYYFQANDTKSNEDIDSFIASIQQKKEELNKNDQVNCKDQLTTAVYEISDNSSTEGEEKLSLDSDNSDKCSNFYKKSSTQKRVKNKQSQELKETIKILNKQKKLEKEHLKEEKKNMQQKQKVIKAATMENQRNLKPEENIKFLRVHIDNEILNSVSGSNIISFLQQNSIQYIVEPQIKSQTIAWSKRSVIKEVDDFGEVIDKIYCREEKELIYVIPWEKAVKLIYSNELLTHVETIKSAYINKNLTVIIYGLQKYFEFKKNKKTNESKNKNIKYTEIEKSFKEAPNITHDQVEFALTDLQLWGKHNCR